MYQALKLCKLFRGLDERDIDLLLANLNRQVKRFRKDDMIALAGDRVTSQMIIADGVVKGEMIDFAGKVIKIEDIESPDLLAPAFLFGKENRYPVNIVAMGDVTILVIPREEFLRLLALSSTVLNNYLDIISNRAQFLSAKMKFLSFQSIKGKLAQYFLAQASSSGSDEFFLDRSQEELSEMFGVTRPSVARAIGELKAGGLILSRGRNVRILDRKGLSAMLK